MFRFFLVDEPATGDLTYLITTRRSHRTSRQTLGPWCRGVTDEHQSGSRPVLSGQKSLPSRSARTCHWAGRILCTRLVVAAPRMTHGFRPIVAVDVFQQADAAGERITLGLVERRLAELAASAGLPVCL